MTHGAGGSTRDRTFAVVHDIRDRTALRMVMHLTCVSGAPGLHIYTLNRSAATHAICGALRDAGVRGPLNLA